jgi:Fur family ferric uptake transcriptional regulator
VTQQDTRNTRQRTAIRDAIAKADAPVSPKEILDLAGEDAEGLGLATVYRTLKLLVEADEIQTVDIPGQSARYEIAGKAHHHHFHCNTCDKVFELAGCCGHFEELTPKGFELESHDVTLFGRCKDCMSKAGGKRAKAKPKAPKHDHKHDHAHEHKHDHQHDHGHSH